MLGRFEGISPALVGRIWRVGRDPRTCSEAQFSALVYEKAIPDLTALLVKEETAPLGNRRPQAVLPYESAILDAFIFDGRYADAESFLKQRLAKRIYPADYSARSTGTSQHDDEEKSSSALSPKPNINRDINRDISALA